MKEIKILLTSVGGGVVPQVISALRKISDVSFKIIGVDVNENAVGKFYCDVFYKVPFGEQIEEYSEKVLDIAKKENLNLIIPLSDGEALVFSKLKNQLQDLGITVMISDYEITSIAVYKDKMLQFLKDKNVAVPDFSIPSNLEEFKDGVYKLGYPNLGVAMKPCYGRGGRGFRIITKDFDEIDHILNNKSEYLIKMERVSELLSSASDFPKILLMQYLKGKDFNIDVYAEQGETLAIIPHERLKPKHGPVETGLLAYDKKVNEVVKEIVKTFKFDGIINIELAYNDEESIDIPMVYEINPRPSATIALNSRTGFDLLKFAIFRKLNLPIEKPEHFNKVEIIRYWDDYSLDYNEKQPLL